MTPNLFLVQLHDVRVISSNLIPVRTHAATNSVSGFKDRDLDIVLQKDVCTSQARKTGTDNAHMRFCSLSNCPSKHALFLKCTESIGMMLRSSEVISYSRHQPWITIVIKHISTSIRDRISGMRHCTEPKISNMTTNDV